MLKNWIYSQNDGLNKFVLSSRIRLARNLKGEVFPHKLDSEKAFNIADKVEKSLDGYSESFKRVDLNSKSNLDNSIYLEKHLISKDLIKASSKSSFFVNDSETISIMINEEDHLRMQFFNSGYNLLDTFNEAMNLDDFIESKIDYAFDEKIGYLTTCPTNLGTGMRASIMIHLPALTMTDHISKVYKALTQVGMTIRGLYGEGSKSEGCIYQVSNQVTLGVSEQDILNNLYAIVKELTEIEINMRKTLFKDYEIEVKDKIFRSIGILSNSYSITSKESLELLSHVRFGIEEGMVKGDICINKILIGCQPASLQNSVENLSLSSKQRDFERAKFLRNSFKNIEVIDKM